MEKSMGKRAGGGGGGGGSINQACRRILSQLESREIFVVVVAKRRFALHILTLQ